MTYEQSCWVKVWEISADIDHVISTAIWIQKKVGRKCPWIVLELIKDILVSQVIHKVESETYFDKSGNFIHFNCARMKICHVLGLLLFCESIGKGHAFILFLFVSSQCVQRAAPTEEHEDRPFCGKFNITMLLCSILTPFRKKS